LKIPSGIGLDLYAENPKNDKYFGYDKTMIGELTILGEVLDFLKINKQNISVSYNSKMNNTNVHLYDVIYSEGSYNESLDMKRKSHQIGEIVFSSMEPDLNFSVR
jgi:hypothetical protein